ncbi:Beta-1, partial [Blattella germanica]
SFHCRTSATKTLKGQTCVGQLLFEDNFDTFNLERWHHEISASGGRYHEFQMFVNNRSNSFVQNGILHIRPTFTEDVFGQDALYNGILDLRGSALSGEKCTNPVNNGCYKHAVGSQILNPIISAQLYTSESFTFQYGIVSVRAKMPKGDWLWPAIYLLPHQNAYGPWPNSGQITIVQSRGNSRYSVNSESLGVERVEMGLQLGPGQNGIIQKHIYAKDGDDWNSGFHNFDVEWTPENIKFSIDGEPKWNITPSLGGGFGSAAGLNQEFNRNVDNSGSIMAPFDQQFYLVISLAVGGISDYFPDKSGNVHYKKPWNNTSPSAMLDFWESKDHWYPTWQGSLDFQVDYVRVWSLP